MKHGRAIEVAAAAQMLFDRIAVEQEVRDNVFAMASYVANDVGQPGYLMFAGPDEMVAWAHDVLAEALGERLGWDQV